MGTSTPSPMLPVAAHLADPILILGNHRSGTTWLYQLLTETDAFSPLTARHVLARQQPCPPPDGIALLQSGTLRRCGDHLPVTPLLPEEYGYVLANGTGDSRLSARTLPTFLTLFADLQAEHHPAPRPVLLKNPWDYAAFLSLADLLPRARFVFIHRHPLRVIHSSARMLGELWAQQDAYTDLISLRYRRMWAQPGTRWLMQHLSRQGGGPLLARLLAGGVFSANAHYARTISRLPPHRWVSLRYEDLCAQPDVVLQQVLDFLAVTPPRSPQTPPRPADTGTLLPAVARLRLPRRLQPYLALHHYGPLPTS